MSFNPEDCPRCMEHYRNSPHATGAAASVGIERGLSTAEVVTAWLASYHQRGHRAR